MLWEHWSNAVQLRANLAAEARLGDMQVSRVSYIATRSIQRRSRSQLEGTLCVGEVKRMKHAEGIHGGEGR